MPAKPIEMKPNITKEDLDLTAAIAEVEKRSKEAKSPPLNRPGYLALRNELPQLAEAQASRKGKEPFSAAEKTEIVKRAMQSLRLPPGETAAVTAVAEQIMADDSGERRDKLVRQTAVRYAGEASAIVPEDDRSTADILASIDPL